MKENEALELGKSLYENITSNTNNIIPATEYVEFVKTAIKAIEKQIPKKPYFGNVVTDYYIYDCMKCPCCNGFLVHENDSKGKHYNYCHNCGQKLDWND